MPNLGLVRSKKDFPEDSQNVTESLYKQNLELAVKNKTLSLLAKLYEISIQTLPPSELGARIASAVQQILNFELVGIYIFSEGEDSLAPLAFASSERMRETQKNNVSFFENTKIENVLKNHFFSSIITNKIAESTESLSDVWGEKIRAEALANLHDAAHMKAVVGYPLIIGDVVVGIFVVALNRSYDALSLHEKDSIRSTINVITVALDKAQ